MSDKNPNLMVLNRTHRHMSRFGHCISFIADVPVNVPPAIHKEALALGATFCDGGELAVPDTMPDDQPTDVQVRIKKVLDAIPSIVARNRRGDFSASGHPKTEVFKDLIGFVPDPREVQTAFAEWRESENVVKQKDKLEHNVKVPKKIIRKSNKDD